MSLMNICYESNQELLREELFMETEALVKLINKINEYQDSLSTNKQILVNAAHVCDATMGKDEISKAYINKLMKALEQLERTSKIAGEVAIELMKEKEEAEIIAREAGANA